jgi:hypothetical protein
MVEVPQDADHDRAEGIDSVHKNIDVHESNIDLENFEVITPEEVEAAKRDWNKESEQELANDVMAKTDSEISLAVDAAERSSSTEVSDDEKKHVITELVELRDEFRHWTEVRLVTVAKLRDIADYIELVSQRAKVAKVAGAGGGAVAGGLTLIGGALTIATAGAALPVMLAGAAMGLASGITGGVAAISEKVIKSRQMREAETALAEDQLATTHLEERVVKLRESKFARDVARAALTSGAGVASDSMSMANLIAGVSNSGVGDLGKLGSEVLSKLLGHDISKEVTN